MSLPENTSPEHKLQLRVDELNNELSRQREISQKQTTKIGNLRLWFYFTSVFSLALFSILFHLFE